MDSRALAPVSTAYDTCMRYNIIGRSHLSPEWMHDVIPDALLPRLAEASEERLQLTGFVKQLVRLEDTFFRFPFVISEKLTLSLVLGTAFADEHVKTHAAHERKLSFVGARSLSIARVVSNGFRE